jgi:hypothetical protein
MRRELGIEVDMVRGGYGVYKILVDGRTIIDGGPKVILGVMPPAKKTVAAVKAELGRG